MKGIKVSEVDVAIATIQASRTLMEDFAQACVIISDFLRVRVGRGMGKNRSIAAVNTHKSGGGGGRGNDGGGGRDKNLDAQALTDCSHIDKCYYPREEFMGFNKI